MEWSGLVLFDIILWYEKFQCIISRYLHLELYLRLIDICYHVLCYFALFGHMLSLTALIPNRHLLVAVVAVLTGYLCCFDLSACDLVLYFILCWYSVGFMLHSFISYLGTTNGCVVPLS